LFPLSPKGHPPSGTHSANASGPHAAHVTISASRLRRYFSHKITVAESDDTQLSLL